MANERSRSFGTAAAAYERYRPEYPDRIVQLVQEYADTTVRMALELGAGTGKATNVFARHGISVTASDPDPDMLAELSRQLPSVRTVQASLEELPPLGPFDLIRETVIEQRLEMMKADWIGYLSTVSAYLVLSEQDRAAALAAVAEVLPPVLELRADITVQLGRRV